MKVSLQWRCSKCGHVEPANVDPSENYAIGDDEPCIYCEDRKCIAIVERAVQAKEKT
jgi:hypothetical protein